MDIFKQTSLIFSGSEDHVKQHPHHSEDEEGDEKDLSVHSSNGHAVESAGADQGAAQDQDVDADYARQEPPNSTVGPFCHCSHVVGSTSGLIHSGNMENNGQILDVFQLRRHFNAGGTGLDNFIWCFSIKQTRQSLRSSSSVNRH